MLSTRSLANALMQEKRNAGKSLREHVATGDVDSYVAAAKLKGQASASTIRKWRRTHEAREAGWLDAKA